VAKVHVVLCMLFVAPLIQSCSALPTTVAPYGVKAMMSVRHSNESPHAYYQLGRYYQARNQLDAAAIAYQKALSVDDGYYEAKNALGVIYSMQGKLDLAIEHFRSALAPAPRSAHLHNNLGHAYYLQHKYQEAINSLEAAAALDPHNQRTLHNLKLAHQSIEKSNAAHSVGEPMVARASTPQPAPSAGAAPAQARSAPDDGIALVAVAPNVYELREQMSRGAGESAAVSVDLPRTHENPVAQVKPFALEVLNGNGITGMAQRVAKRLERIGMKTVLLTNQLPFQQASTEIQYRKGYRAEAARLGSALRAPMSVVKNEVLRDDIHVRLVLGRDVLNEAALFEPGGSKTRIADAKPFRLEVSNGNGITGMAQRLAVRLEHIGVKTVRLTNELPFQQASTEMQYREGYRAEATGLGATLQVPMSVVKSEVLRNDIHVRLVLGRDVHSEGAFFESGGSRMRMAAHGNLKTAR